jgi:hypothetical protein
MACRSGCKTKDHTSWGECARAAQLHVAPAIQAIPARRAWDAELHAYGEARRQGLQPKGTTMRQVQAAVEAADAA